MHDLTIETIRINGGRLCLDFVNTRTYRGSGENREFLLGFADLVHWGKREALIENPEAKALLELAACHSSDAQRALVDAHAFRTTLRSLFEPGVTKARLERALVDLSAATLTNASSLHLEIRGNAIRFTPAAAFDTWLIGPLAISALALATSPERSQIRACPGEDCHWLFLDQSRNGTRRWCSMDSCGSKAKARTHYDVHRRPQRQPDIAS